MNWLSRQDFTQESAIQQIDTYIRQWNRHDEWLYCIDFVSKNDSNYFTEYTFRVRWSIPKDDRPIPKASASVYFTYKLLKNMPKSTQSQVNIRYECNTNSSDSSGFKFNEACLYRILDCKAKSLEGQVF